MSVIALGLNHTTAPLDLRGRFAFPGDRLVPTLRAFSSRLQRASEVAIVSTCNRTELYVGSAGTAGEATGELAGQAHGLAGRNGRYGRSMSLQPPLLRAGRRPDAARHTFRLASGLSSMVVGETQILGQMKQAVREADTAGTLGSTLHQLFQRSFAVAKEVRSTAPRSANTRSASRRPS